MSDQQPPPLPAYSGTMSSCPKCGTIDASTEWRPNGACIVDGRESVVHTTGGLVRFAEHLCRRCRCCGYHWDEAPLDVADPDRALERAAAAEIASQWVKDRATLTSVGA